MRHMKEDWSLDERLERAQQLLARGASKVERLREMVVGRPEYGPNMEESLVILCVAEHAYKLVAEVWFAHCEPTPEDLAYAAELLKQPRYQEQLQKLRQRAEVDDAE